MGRFSIGCKTTAVAMSTGDGGEGGGKGNIGAYLQGEKAPSTAAGPFSL